MRFLVLLLFLSLVTRAQKDSAITIPMLGVHFGAQIPLGDLDERFGNSFTAGGSFMLKTHKNWILGVEASYLFGGTVKEDVLEQLTNPDGFVTDNEGYPANLRITQRGLILGLTFGKVIPIFKSNANSGLMITIGAGYLQHKVHIYDASQRVASIAGDLIKGYDRFTSGISVSQFIGYLHMGRKRLSNFYAGFEFYEAFTQSVRKLNYSTGLPDTAKRNDILMGFRIGWILPLYKKAPDDFYVY
ncbi:MAG: hypothetical protein JNK73_10355 [Bacteroidia bacterium]|nr:hypothetical protein [Bacteroidia bacterium]